MRSIVVFLLLAGCASPSEPADVPEPVAEEPTLNITRSTLIDASVTWHEEGNAALDTYSQVAQQAAHPCVWRDGEEVYFTNQPLGAAPLPEGTGELIITLDWDDTSYLREALRIAHRGPNATLYETTVPFARGEEMRIPVTPDDWAEGDDRSWGRGYELWACLDTDTGDGLVPPSIFAGELRYTIEVA